MFRPLLSLMTAATILLSASAALAQNQTPAGGQEKYTFETPHTQIMFSVNHLGFTNSHGRFLGYEGSFILDRVDPAKSSVEATIRTDSLDMGDDKWNEHLKSADFFDVAKFPAMTFKSSAVAKTGEKTADVTGDLTLHGVTKPVTLKVVYNNSGVLPMNDKIYVAGFSATTVIKRSEFGMGYGTPMVGDDVTVTLEVQGNQVGYKGADKGKE